jgi:hypothetical protein
MNPGLKLPLLFTVRCSLYIIYHPSCGQHIQAASRSIPPLSITTTQPVVRLCKPLKTTYNTQETREHEGVQMSVLNVNMPERDLDPEEIDLEQEEEDAFGECPSIRNR